jgi:hypothetical protein
MKWVLFVYLFLETLWEFSALAFEAHTSDIPENHNTHQLQSLRTNPIYSIKNSTSDNEYLSWNELIVTVDCLSKHKVLLQETIPVPSTIDTSFFVHQPVYVTLTALSKRVPQLMEAVRTLVQAKVRPTKIFVVLSYDSFLMDSGFHQDDIPDALLSLVVAGYVSIVVTENVGPHRKLLPVLKRYFNQDVFIVTVDDDLTHLHGYTLLYQLLKQFMHHGKPRSIVALKVRRIGINVAAGTVGKFVLSKDAAAWSLMDTAEFRRPEMLLLPVGSGGVLYHPSYFSKVVFNNLLRKVTVTADDVMYRLVTMARNVTVLPGCGYLWSHGPSTSTSSSTSSPAGIRACPRDPEDDRFEAMYAAQLAAANAPLSFLDSDLRRATVEAGKYAAAVVLSHPPSPSDLNHDRGHDHNQNRYHKRKNKHEDIRYNKRSTSSDAGGRKKQEGAGAGSTDANAKGKDEDNHEDKEFVLFPPTESELSDFVIGESRRKLVRGISPKTFVNNKYIKSLDSVNLKMGFYELFKSGVAVSDALHGHFKFNAFLNQFAHEREPACFALAGLMSRLLNGEGSFKGKESERVGALKATPDIAKVGYELDKCIWGAEKNLSYMDRLAYCGLSLSS